jgi:hypothetical protein
MAGPDGRDSRFPTISLISIDWTYAAEAYRNGGAVQLSEEVLALAAEDR